MFVGAGRLVAHWSRQANQGGFWVFVYLGVVIIALVFGFVRAGLFFLYSIAASSRIHDGMLAAVLGAPLAFFHANPVGRVLNRFSADQGIMDDMLPQVLYNFLQVRAC